MLEKRIMLRGIDNPSKYAKENKTNASYEITHLPKGLPARSVSWACAGVPAFSNAGFIIVNPDLTKFSSISVMDEETGVYKKEAYLFSSRLPATQVEEELKKLQKLHAQGGRVRTYETGYFNHNELVYDLEKKDIFAIYYSKEYSFHYYDSRPETLACTLGESLEWSECSSQIQAINLQKEYFLIHNELLDIYEYESNSPLRLQPLLNNEEIIHLWKKLMASFVKVMSKKDPCLFLTMSMNEIKIAATYGILIKEALPPDHNYESELKEQLNEKLELLIDKTKANLISATLSAKKVAHFEAALNCSVKELRTIMEESYPEEDINKAIFEETRRIYSYVTFWGDAKDLPAALKNLIEAAVIPGSSRDNIVANEELLLLKESLDSKYFKTREHFIQALTGLFNQRKFEAYHIAHLYQLCEATTEKDFLLAQCKKMLGILKTGSLLKLTRLDEFFEAALSLGCTKEEVSAVVRSLIWKRDEFACLLPYFHLSEEISPNYFDELSGENDIDLSDDLQLVLRCFNSLKNSLYSGQYTRFSDSRVLITEALKAKGYECIPELISNFIKITLLTYNTELLKDIDEKIKKDFVINDEGVVKRVKRSTWAGFYKAGNDIPFNELKSIMPLYSKNNPEFGSLPQSAFKLLMILGLRILLKKNGQMERFLQKVADVNLPIGQADLLDRLLTRTLDKLPDAILDKQIQEDLVKLHPEFAPLIAERLNQLKHQPRSFNLEDTVYEHIMPLAQEALIFAHDNYLVKKYTNEEGSTHFPILYKQGGKVVVSPAKRYEAFIEDEDGGVVYRSNHGLARTARTMYLLHLVIDYNLNHAIEPLKQYLSSQLRFKETRDKFITKLQIALAFYVTGREGEQGFTTDDYKEYRNASARNFENYAKKFGLFENKEERILYADCLANSYYKGDLNKETQASEKIKGICIKILLHGAHCVDQVRLWEPEKIRNETVYDFMKGVVLPNDDDKEKALHIFNEAARLCQAMGDSVAMIYDATAKKCKKPKISFFNPYDTNFPKADLEAFFDFSLNPISCIDFLNRQSFNVLVNPVISKQLRY